MPFASTSAGSFRCVWPSSAEEALTIARAEDITVVVTDQRMPRMTGLDLLKAMRDVRPDAVGIIVTAFTDVEVLDRGGQPGPHLPLRHQALGQQRAEGHHGPGHRTRAPGAREPPAAGTAGTVRARAVQRSPQRLQLWRHRGRFAAAARGAGQGRAGGADRGHGAFARRDRHRQRDGGARDSHQQPARGAALHPRQLRRAGARRAGIRALRPRKRRVHRRHGPARRGVSSWPTAARCSSTRSATSPRTCRSSCCACCKSGSSSGWAGSRP